MFPLANSIGAIVIARFVDRVGKGIRGAPRDALIAASADSEHRGKAFGLEGIGDNFGAFLGPLIAVALIDSALKTVKNDVSKKEELRKALEKADFKSVRGDFKFGPNHIPIQNFYLQDAVKQGDDYVLKTVATIVENDQDRHWQKCPMAQNK